MQVIKTQAKEIFTKTKLPGSDWAINQYVGCEHNCSYCYAKFMSRWKKHGKWGSWVEVKINAPELVKNRLVDGWIFMSSVSDAYQPIEKKLKLTRKILENLDKRSQISILTKSNLVTRDIDLIKQFKKAEIGFTINSFKGKEKELFEPSSPTSEERIEALKKLHENGITTYAFVSPIVPGLIDIEDIIAKTKDCADYYWFEMMNLRGAGKEFIDLLKTKYPKSYKILQDKNLLNKYIEELKYVIKKSKIRTKGIEIH